MPSGINLLTIQGHKQQLSSGFLTAGADSAGLISRESGADRAHGLSDLGNSN
jgi:hypothetical protein